MAWTAVKKIKSREQSQGPAAAGTPSKRCKVDHKGPARARGDVDLRLAAFKVAERRRATDDLRRQLAEAEALEQAAVDAHQQQNNDLQKLAIIPPEAGEDTLDASLFAYHQITEHIQLLIVKYERTSIVALVCKAWSSLVWQAGVSHDCKSPAWL